MSLIIKYKKLIIYFWFIFFLQITNLVENGKLKCHKYWPGGQGPEGQFPDTENYGEFTVTLKEESQRNFYVLRVFDVKYVSFITKFSLPDNSPIM